ncbi:Uncharacterized protein FWK35_00001259, partial [Aphis craccivora]
MMLITSRNNTPISNFGGGFRCKSEYPWCIIEVKISKKSRKTKKNDGKTGIFTQNQFSTNSVFLYGCNSKTNCCKYLKFSPNVYVSVIYTELNFQKTSTFFVSNFYEICRKRENLQDLKYNINISRRHNFFLLAFELRVENLIQGFSQNLNFGVFRSLKHKQPFSPTTWKLYPRLTNHLRSESFFVYNDN